MARESDKEDRRMREEVEAMNRHEEARRRMSYLGKESVRGRGRGRGGWRKVVGGSVGRGSVRGKGRVSDGDSVSDEEFDSPEKKIEEKVDDEAKKKGLTLKQRNALFLELKVEALLKEAGFKQFNKDTLADLIRLDKSNPGLMDKYGLTLNNIEQYQRKYSPEERTEKASTEGPIIQKYLALRHGGNVLVHRSVNRRSKMM
jgi:hypothetical protein